MNASTRTFQTKNYSRRTNGRNRKGEAIISVVFGSTILIVICLFAADIIFLALANSANDTLARNAARAAANQQDAGTAVRAASGVVTDFHTSALIPAASLTNVAYTSDQVVVKTTINVKLPASLLGWPSALTFVAQDGEAVVGKPSTL